MTLIKYNKFVFLVIIVSTILLHSCYASSPDNAIILQKPPSHELWNTLLKKHVTSDGWVNYKGFKKDQAKLETYLKILKKGVPDPKSWSQEEQLAYWINAYNAFTVKLIIDNYPLKSIKDLNSTLAIPTVNTIWDKKFFNLGGQAYSLNMIEHSILRKNFDEPRIHFALNCASVSCPVLLNEAYSADILEKQLEQQTKEFINDPTKNSISTKNPNISSLFNWYGEDFKKKGTLIEYLNSYSKVKINPNARISFLDYDWNLNEK
jgi:hypothetical protein